ncbi:MAG: glucosidase [Acidimicrobiia bacterium]|nr:glucosidase [Acidimicrobiia bacterium]
MNRAEHRRLADNPTAWRRWGPYLAERAWGTVREDYSPGGTAWDDLPHDHARSRAYRWNEDGMGGLCDDHQILCLAFAFWNGADPILKERIFGLTGNEGNHGEDAKEYWWFLDSTPTHSFMRWRYWYPQGVFPYAHLVEENRRRGRLDPEYELVDTGIFDDDRYWEITVDYAKAAPDRWCIELRARNAGPEAATLHVLPTLWFRNTWAWGLDDRRPRITAKDGTLVAEHHALDTMVLAGDGSAPALVCDNDTNGSRLWGAPSGPRFPKDGINDHVVHGAATVNPDGTGTKGALWHRLTVAPGATATVCLTLGPAAEPAPDQPNHVATVLAARRAEADEFYGEVLAGLDPEGAAIARQALAGMMWTKQWYHLDVERWLDGDPAGPPPPASRQRGRNREWRHLNNADVITVCDTWEYPWYATWDLAFQCVAIAHVDPGFAKDQLRLMCREWYMHPNGQLPAYEWAFGDVNPPVHAWAALRVLAIDAAATGRPDLQFLEEIFHKLLLNFTWWVNRKDAEGDNVFEGGFLGMDNIGPLDRSAPLPVAGRLEQSDATGWMALFCLNLLEMSILLTERSMAYEAMATKFLEHFAYIAAAIDDRGLWDDNDGFYYDVLRMGDERIPLRVRSMVGLLPLCAVTTLGPDTLARLPGFAASLDWFVRNKPQYARHIDHRHTHSGTEGRLLAIVGPERLGRILARLLDEGELLSPHGIRSVSQRHRDQPFVLDLAGMRLSVDYAPGEGTTGLFGGNSNWRGPIWFPVNALVVEALRAYGRFFGDDEQVELPVGSGHRMTFAAAAGEVADRLVGLFREGPDGRRPVHGAVGKFHTDAAWHSLIPFHEYFHGDTGAGLGASHQTGWTGLVADLLLRRS